MRFSRRTFALSATAAPLLGPTVSRAQSATPATTAFDDASDRIAGLLQYVPGGMLDGELNLVWTDPERQVAAIRDHAGAAAEEQTDAQIAMMALYANGPELFSYAQMLEELAGYSFDALHQSLQFGSLPNAGLLVKLGVDAESLIPFWESLDYESRENEYGRFWTIGEDAEYSLDHPVQQALLSRLNNIAIIEDDTIAYTQTSDVLEQIMSTASGDTPNRIAELEPTFSGLPADATSAWVMDGNILEFENLLAQEALSAEFVARVEDMLAESDEAAGPMPAIRTIFVGVMAGASMTEELHNPESREFIILETDDADMAEQAAAVITWRTENLQSMNTGEPYSELLPNLESEVLDGEFLRASQPLAAPRAMLPQMIVGRDTLLFAY